MEFQQLANLISKLDLPAKHIKILGEDLRDFRCGGLNPDWIQYVLTLLSGGIVGKYGAAPPKFG
jgi:hypothetical protein